MSDIEYNYDESDYLPLEYEVSPNVIFTSDIYLNQCNRQLWDKIQSLFQEELYLYTNDGIEIVFEIFNLKLAEVEEFLQKEGFVCKKAMQKYKNIDDYNWCVNINPK